MNYIYPSLLRQVLLLLMVTMLMACEPEAASDAEASEAAEDTTMAESVQPPAPGAKLNLNTATKEEFLTVPDVGDRMVREFFEYRPYISIQQFRREIGKYVDEAQVAAYETYVFVPIDPNESDAATLQQIPGVDATEAEALIAERPYASHEAFLEKLGAYVTEEEQTMASMYLMTP